MQIFKKLPSSPHHQNNTKSSHPTKQKKLLRFLLPSVAIIMITVITLALIRMFTFDTTPSVILTYQVPSLPQLENLLDLNYDGAWAVAVDERIASTSTNQPDSTDIQRPTASTAKMILALAIMQHNPFPLGETGDTLTITPEMYQRYVWYVANNGSVTAVTTSADFSQYDALCATLIASSNNMADTLAVWAFGSLENYQAYATDLLAQWGIKHTTIGVDASGFDASTTSTPSDLALIAQKVLKNPVLAQIVSTTTYDLPIAGTITNTNKLLGTSNIVGVKTGYIGEPSGYCLVAGYRLDDHIITTALLNSPTREDSFADSQTLITHLQTSLIPSTLTQTGQNLGYYDGWWLDNLPAIRAAADTDILGWQDNTTPTAEFTSNINTPPALNIEINQHIVTVATVSDSIAEPSLWQRFLHLFGWKANRQPPTITANVSPNDEEHNAKAENNETDINNSTNEITLLPITSATSSNCTVKYGYLMLINPNFTVDTDFIATRRTELISLSATYGIVEGNAYNGDNLLDAEAASHLNDLVKAYKATYSGHTLETRSCFRSVGTQCGRLCAATGASDHHTGLTCDLLDPFYGTSLDTDEYSTHTDWQWLRENSYKYGFIDRFPEAWAGGPMSQPLNVDENGSTGLYETWHYRYVGITPATEIATGKYNNGNYDSLEHYLKAKGLVSNLRNGGC